MPPSSFESLYLDACAQGYSLDPTDFAQLYAYTRTVHRLQHQQESEFKLRRTFVYPLSEKDSANANSNSKANSNSSDNANATTETEEVSWLSAMHSRIEQELANNSSSLEFPQLTELQRRRLKTLSAVRNRRLHPAPPTPVLAELPADSAAVINEAQSATPSTKTLIERFCIPITPRDLSTLTTANGWLNDEIINFYFELIAERSAGSVHVMNTFFYPKVKDLGYAAVRRWTRKVDIFARQKILIPVHLGVHWCVAEVDVSARKILYYDSLHGNNPLCLQILLEWLKAEHQDKRSSPLPDADSWELCCAHHLTPAQQNGYDCGVFTCVIAEYRARGAELTFTQADMAYFRRRLAYEILTGRLLE